MILSIVKNYYTGEVVIGVIEHSPEPGAIVTQAFTYPTLMIEFPTYQEKITIKNTDGVEFQELNVGKIQDLINNKVISDTTLNREVLYGLGVLRKINIPLKVLGNGELTSSINITADRFTASAKEKIEKAGGTVTING